MLFFRLSLCFFVARVISVLFFSHDSSPCGEIDYLVSTCWWYSGKCCSEIPSRHSGKQFLCNIPPYKFNLAHQYYSPRTVSCQPEFH